MSERETERIIEVLRERGDKNARRAQAAEAERDSLKAELAEAHQRVGEVDAQLTNTIRKSDATWQENQALVAALAETQQALQDAHHALRHLYPRPYAAPEQLSEYESWQRAVVTAGLSDGAHPCGDDLCPLANVSGAE